MSGASLNNSSGVVLSLTTPKRWLSRPSLLVSSSVRLPFDCLNTNIISGMFCMSDVYLSNSFWIMLFFCSIEPRSLLIEDTISLTSSILILSISILLLFGYSSKNCFIFAMSFLRGVYINLKNKRSQIRTPKEIAVRSDIIEIAFVY